MTRKAWVFSVLIMALAALSIGPIFAQGKAPEVAKTSKPTDVVEVTVTKLNLRAGSGTNYPVIQSLNKNAKLIVVGEKSGWLEVRIPEETKCWITKKYVDITDKNKGLGVVKVGRINVRSRPETGENIIGNITEGQIVTVKSEKGEWYQIAPTENLTGWVNKKYTRYWGNYQRHQELTSQTVQDEQSKKSLTEVFNEAEKLYDAELEKPPLQQNYKKAMARYKEVINNTSDKELLEKSRERVSQIEPKQQILDEYVIVIQTSQEQKKAIEERYKARLADFINRLNTPEPYNGRGWLESEGKYIGRPAGHKITMGGKTLFFLKGSSSINLDDYYGQYVGVKGKKIANKSGVAETIIVDKIDFLIEGDQ